MLLGSQLAEANISPLFATDTPLAITLTGPWASLASDTASEPEARPATLEIANGEKFSLKVSPRGKSRRRKEFCAFPPLWLDFKRSEVKDSVFAGQNKLKLVTHCGRLGIRNTEYSDRLHSEYLLYRIFQEIDHRSFLVRAVRINYVDNKRNKSYSHPGFIIEHKRALAERLEAVLVKETAIPLAELDASYTANASLFAFLAGNTDFAFTSGANGENCCHNAVPLRLGESVITVPYDFDATGFVNPPYAAPLPALRIKLLTQRKHRGYCKHSAQVSDAIARLQGVRAEITALIDNHQHLTDRRKKRLLKFTKEFYTLLANPKKADRHLLKTCR